MADAAHDGMCGHGHGIVTLEFRIGRGSPKENHQSENESPCFSQKGPTPIGNVAENVAPLREPVGRQLEEEMALCLVRSEPAPQDPRDEKGGDRTEHIDGEKNERLFCPTLAATEEHGDEEEIDGQSSRAAHPGGHEDRHEAFLRRIDRAGRHDPWNGAGIGAQQGKEGLSAEAGLGHDSVHQEGRPRHVAGALEQADKKEEQQNL